MSIFLYPILSLLSALLVVNAVIPEVIRVAAAKGLFDVPGGRKGHAAPTPTAGGIAIFMGVMVAAFGWGGSESLNTFQPLMLGMVVLFFLGLKDDLMGASAGFKLMIQLALAAVLVGGGMGLHAFWGMLGWHGLPLPLQYAASVLLVVLVTNAYNLIDGIDGLAGGIGLIASLCFGIIFMVRGEAAFAILAFALAGGLLAFLRYNFQPAKIFMGDTGSLVVGFLLSAMMLHLLERSVAPGARLALAAPVLVMLVMAVPLGDLIQVVITRLLNGAHPFSADRRHLHHQLLSLGLSHRHAAFVLWGATLFLLAISPLLICEETFFCYLRVGGMVGGLILLLRFTLVWGARRRVSVYRLRGVSEGE